MRLDVHSFLHARSFLTHKYAVAVFFLLNQCLQCTHHLPFHRELNSLNPMDTKIYYVCRCVCVDGGGVSGVECGWMDGSRYALFFKGKGLSKADNLMCDDWKRGRTQREGDGSFASFFQPPSPSFLHTLLDLHTYTHIPLDIIWLFNNLPSLSIHSNCACPALARPVKCVPFPFIIHDQEERRELLLHFSYHQYPYTRIFQPPFLLFSLFPCWSFTSFFSLF